MTYISTAAQRRLHGLHESRWRRLNNSAALGYAIKAAREFGLSDKQIKYLIHEMESQMDLKTEEQAEKEYREF